MNAHSTQTFLCAIGDATLSRRGFIGAGGALAVALSINANAQAPAGTLAALDAHKPQSWIDIHADNSITIRTGKCDFGQSSIYTAYRQIVADELGVPASAITEVISGDTDRTPDGGGTFGLLRTNVLNLRKAAAYTREAVLELAAKKFGVARAAVRVANGVISGGGKSATYGELVAGQDLQLTIPTTGEQTGFVGVTVTGNPPLTSKADYKEVGKPLKNPLTLKKVAGEVTWVGDVKLPHMLHARVVHPDTLGSKLLKAGALDTKQFPHTKLVVIGNLVAVAAPNEWEAIQAARAVAAETQWSGWKGLPSSEKLEEYLKSKTDYSQVPASKGAANKGDVTAAKAMSATTHAASYFMPYFKHAPIAPMCSLADMKPDGSVMLHTHSQNAQFLRAGIAKMLGSSVDKVIVRTYAGAGHFGRSNGGSAGSEDEAVLLSKHLGVPVRVQWMRGDDMQWSTQSSPMRAEIEIGVDAAGKIATYKAAHFGPPMQDDRLVGAVLAGMPVIDAPVPENKSFIHSAVINMADKWIYQSVPNVAESGHGMWQVGQKESPLNIGLRDHSMRTPIQFQQNFPRESAISEAAAKAGKDALQFRLDNVTDPRFIALLTRLREEAGWETRPSPAPQAKASGSAVVRGRGVSLMLRDNGYWACAAQISVVPETGAVKVEKVTLVVDTGVVVNPLQLKRQVQAGCLMGVSQALHEEVTFDEGAITSADWYGYPILTMAEAPEVKVVLAPDAQAEIYGQGSESANALAAPAIVAAFHDATGKPARRLPLRPDYVKAMLAA
jgi:nicotinate dehydrogenase subunit B